MRGRHDCQCDVRASLWCQKAKLADGAGVQPNDLYTGRGVSSVEAVDR
jgi:hypothetical protein